MQERKIKIIKEYNKYHIYIENVKIGTGSKKFISDLKKKLKGDKICQ